MSSRQLAKKCGLKDPANCYPTLVDVENDNDEVSSYWRPCKSFRNGSPYQEAAYVWKDTTKED